MQSGANNQVHLYENKRIYVKRDLQKKPMYLKKEI